MIIGYNRRFILNLRCQKEEEISFSEREQDFRMGLRPCHEQLREICTAEYGTPKLGYATTSRDRFRRQPREYFDEEINWDLINVHVLLLCLHGGHTAFKP